jgi:hypothetical protein
VTYCRGFIISIRGLSRCIRDPSLLVTYADFFKTFFVFVSVLYGAFIVASIFLIPFVLIVSVWAPGLLWQLLTIIPFWAYLLAKAKSPLKNDMLFIVIKST